MNKLSTKIGITATAILYYLAESGTVTLDNILSGRKMTLGQKYRRMDAIKSIGDYYDILSSAKENSLRTILWRLRKRGLVKKNNEGYALNFLGKAFLSKIKKVDKYSWDGKWRLVMFDVPETKRAHRVWLNYKLINYDYKPLQKSVLIGKKPLDEDLLLELVKRGLYQHVRIITVGEIDNDNYLPS
ncbi:MAG: hypothetical protein Q8Q37_02230 [bacterium]|nr:hypothetical protein [bacterium]